MALLKKKKVEAEREKPKQAARIAIISINMYTSVLNFASVLHSYIFQQFLKDNGIETTIIDYKPNFGNDILDGRHPILYYAANQPKDLNDNKYKYNLKRWAKLFDEREKRYDKFQKFIDKYYIKTEETYDQNTIAENPPDFDIYIAATDVIWKYTEHLGFDRGFLLEPFKGKKKIAYSASRGAIEYSPEAEKDFFNCISDIDYISVREKSLKDYIESKSNLPVKLVLDPVFLENKEFYENLAVRKPRKNKYVLVYIVMNKSPKVLKNAAKYAKENGLKLIELSDRIEDENLPKGTHHKVIYGIGIEEWLGYLIDAEMIFTNSFHASALSIIMHKQFVAGVRAADKIRSLLQMFNLEDRLIEDYDPERVLSLQPIDYEKVDVTREKLVKESSDFILNAIHDLENNEHQNHRDLVNEDVFSDDAAGLTTQTS